MGWMAINHHKPIVIKIRDQNGQKMGLMDLVIMLAMENPHL